MPPFSIGTRCTLQANVGSRRSEPPPKGYTYLHTNTIKLERCCTHQPGEQVANVDTNMHAIFFQPGGLLWLHGPWAKFHS